MSGAGSFEFVEDVTSDLAFVAWGETHAETFGAAAEALLHATLESPESLRDSERRRVELSEPDIELLLLRFLNELVYLRDAEHLLLRARQVRVEVTPTGAHLTADLVGETVDASRHRLTGEVKAATAHGLSLTRAGSGFRATVTLDV